MGIEHSQARSRVVLDVKGNGTKTTQRFTVGDRWIIRGRTIAPPPTAGVAILLLRFGVVRVSTVLPVLTNSALAGATLIIIIRAGRTI